MGKSFIREAECIILFGTVIFTVYCAYFMYVLVLQRSLLRYTDSSITVMK